MKKGTYIHRKTKKKKRRGIHAKTKTSNHKRSKNYVKKNKN